MNSKNRVSTECDLYCCLLPQCGALHTCCSSLPIATMWGCDQDAKVVPAATFTIWTCDRLSSLWKGGDVVATFLLALHWMRDSPWTEYGQKITPTVVCVAWTSKNRVVPSGYLCCCLLPQCEALHTCHSGFPIVTLPTVVVKSLQEIINIVLHLIVGIRLLSKVVL